MSAVELLALADRCEAATGADRKLDRAIWYTLQESMIGDPVHGPKFTASLDAAIGLVPEGLHPGISENIWHLHWHAWMGRQDSNGSPDDVANANAATPALALCAAALRARAAAKGDE